MDDFALLEITVKLTQIIVPMIIIFGTCGNILNILILTRQRLRGYACSLYFVALSIVNVFYTSVVLVFNLLTDGHNIDPAKHSNVFCKIISYFLNLCPMLAVTFIVLASIDRYCSSSVHVRVRRFSQLNIARAAISIATSVIVVLMVGSLIVFDLRDDGAGCTTRSDSLFNQVFLFVEIVLYAVIAPCLLILFGTLTIVNTTRIGQHRVGVSRTRRTEKELARMLIVQVASHVLLSAPFCVFFLLLVVPTPFRYTLRFFVIFTLCKIPIYMTYLSPFFLYILSARIYRQELMALIARLLRVVAHAPPNPTNSVAPIHSLEARDAQPNNSSNE